MQLLKIAKQMEDRRNEQTERNVVCGSRDRLQRTRWIPAGTGGRFTWQQPARGVEQPAGVIHLTSRRVGIRKPVGARVGPGRLPLGYGTSRQTSDPRQS